MVTAGAEQLVNSLIIESTDNRLAGILITD